MNAAERRATLNSNQTAKIVWIGIMILEGIYLAVLVVGFILGTSLVKDLTANLHTSATPVALITLGYIFAVVINLLFPLLFVLATFQLDKWVRWLLWINVFFTLPSILLSVRGLLAGLIGILIAVGYGYVLRQIYPKTTPTPVSGPTTQSTGSKNTIVNKILVATIVFVVLGSGFAVYDLISKSPSIISNLSEQVNKAAQGDTNRVIANVHIPLAIDSGIFLGKLEQFDFQAGDLPSEFGPYTSQRVGNGYQSDPKIILANDKDAQQFYESALSNNLTGDLLAQGHIQVATFTTTYGSSLYYALGKSKSESKLQTFSGIPFEHFVVKQNSNSSLDPDWFVEILDSNAIFFLYIDVASSANQTTVESIVQKWLKHVDAYKPGTLADVKSENAKGESTGGSQ